MPTDGHNTVVTLIAVPCRLPSATLQPTSCLPCNSSSQHTTRTLCSHTAHNRVKNNDCSDSTCLLLRGLNIALWGGGRTQTLSTLHFYITPPHEETARYQRLCSPNKGKACFTGEHNTHTTCNLGHTHGPSHMSGSDTPTVS